MSTRPDPIADLPRLDGKNVLITGGTRGIGREAALGLLALGATVTIVGRKTDVVERAVNELRARSGQGKIDGIAVDLSTVAGAQLLAKRYAEKHATLDVLVNNVGIILRERALTSEGIERTVSTNAIVPLALTRLLIPQLRAADSARVVFVSSDGHRGLKLDLDALPSNDGYLALDVYVRSKLVALMLAYSLRSELAVEGIALTIADPGMAGTELTLGMTADMAPAPIKWMLPVLRIMLRRSPANVAARSSIYAAATTSDVAGRYIGPKLTLLEPSTEAADPIKIARLRAHVDALPALHRVFAPRPAVSAR